MTPISSIHFAIADVLMDCAAKKKLITYKELCEKVAYPYPRRMGAVIDPLTKFTYENYGVFLSALVYKKETAANETPLPGKGFFRMYEDICGKTAKTPEQIVAEQRKKVFAVDWSNLPAKLKTAV